VLIAGCRASLLGQPVAMRPVRADIAEFMTAARPYDETLRTGGR
jgi:hypothetical protein